MLGAVYLCASMVDSAPLLERLIAARDAGYAGIGLRPTHLKAAAVAGLTVGDVRSMLDDCGLGLTEIGFVADWWETGEKAAASLAFERSLYAMTEVLGGAHIVLISGPATDGVDALAERFAGVCDRAAEHGLRVGLETLPWTDGPTIGAAWEIIDRSGRANGGPILDTWHIHRGGTTPEMLRAVPAERVVAVQLSDGRFEAVGSGYDDTFRRRCLPGHGEFDLARFVRLVEGMGVAAPLGVEVLSDELRALPAAEVARLGMAATREVLAAARSAMAVPS
jgi:sugar phosphate isomerase/epimerase